MSYSPEFVTTNGKGRSLNDICIVSCGIGPEYQEGLHSTRLHCQVNAPEAWRLFYRDYPEGCPPHSEKQYAFKIHAMARAIAAGFRYVVWMDATFQPIASMQPLWDVLAKTGWYVAPQGEAMLGNWCSDHFLDIVQAEREPLMSVPLVYSGLVALDMTSTSGKGIWHWWQLLNLRGAFNGPHRNTAVAGMKSWGVKWEGFCSADPRVEGHRHDEAALSWILHGLGLKPPRLGFLTMESPDGFIGHHVPLVIPSSEVRKRMGF